MIAIKQDRLAIKRISKIKFPQAHEYWRLLYG